MIKSAERIKLAAKLLKHNPEKVLDLGCGEGVLRTCLPQNTFYQGLDLKEEKDIMGFDLERGIPFPDNAFDAVFALEVLEHLENIYFVFEEMLRVSKKEAVIALPNMFHWTHRLKYLFGKEPLIKHDFYPEKRKDRHRWLVGFRSASEFIKHNVNGRRVETTYAIYPYKINLLRKIDSIFSGLFPNVFVYTIFFHIDLTKENQKYV